MKKRKKKPVNTASISGGAYTGVLGPKIKDELEKIGTK